MSTNTTTPTTAIITSSNNVAPVIKQKNFAERMTQLQKLNAQAGYDLMPGTIVPQGTALIPFGDQRLRALKADINGLPDADTALSTAAGAYADMEPVDVVSSLGDWRMSPRTGKIAQKQLDGSWSPAIGYNHNGLSQKLAMHSSVVGIPRGAVGMLEYLDVPARAAAFNDIAQRADKDGTGIKRVFRTLLNGNGERFLRAVTSEKHVLTKGDTAALCYAIKKTLRAAGLKDAKCRVVITHDRTEIEVFFPMFNRELKVGDVALARQRIVISETKDISAQVTDGLLRILCLNFTTAWYGRGEDFTRRHVGDNFLRDIAAAMVDGVTRLQPFVEAFGDANSNPFPETMQTRAEVIERAEKVFKGTLPASTWQASSTLWDADGVSGTAGDTLAGLVNAMTRASQAMALDDADKVERAAGRLVVEGWSALA